MIAAALLIEEGDQAVEDESCWDVVVTKVDEFQHSPGIEHGQCGLANPEQLLMESRPLLKSVVSLLYFILVQQNDLLELVLLDAFHLTFLTLLLHQ